MPDIAGARLPSLQGMGDQGAELDGIVAEFAVEKRFPLSPLNSGHAAWPSALKRFMRAMRSSPRFLRSGGRGHGSLRGHTCFAPQHGIRWWSSPMYGSGCAEFSASHWPARDQPASAPSGHCLPSAEREFRSGYGLLLGVGKTWGLCGCSLVSAGSSTLEYGGADNGHPVGPLG